MKRVKAPWTDEQVAALNRWQQYGFVHEFTCSGDHSGERTLRATSAGWICPTCGETQSWAHDFMFEPQVNPLGKALSGWTVFDHPRDYPDYFVARRWLANRDGTVTQTNSILIARSVGDLRGKLLGVDPGLTMIPRNANDDPKIVEVWL